MIFTAMNLSILNLVTSALLLSLPFAYAQVDDGGVNRETDEFTGTSTCSHYVDETTAEFEGITLTKSTDEVLPETVIYVRHAYQDSDWVLNSAGSIADTTLYMIFGDGEPVTYSADFVSVNTDNNYETLAVMDTALANRIMSSPSDIRVRFSASNGNADFTINHAVVTTLAAGFGQECL